MVDGQRETSRADKTDKQGNKQILWCIAVDMDEGWECEEMEKELFINYFDVDPICFHVHHGNL